MNELTKIFNYGNRQVRTIVKDNEPWFIAKDVCDVLEISNSRDALNRLEGDEKDGVVLTDTIGRQQEMQAVNEYGLYNLVLGSRKPEAKQFKRWITHEVIPSIRKHGIYATEELLDNPDFAIEALKKLKEEREARKFLEAQIEKDKPKVIFAEALEISDHTILIGELAKLLKQNEIDIGQNRLFEKLRKDGYLGIKGEYYNMPTQKSMDLKLFEIKTRTINNPDGSVRVTKTVKVNGKGQMYFINKFKDLNLSA